MPKPINIDEYIAACEESFRDLDKDFPIFWKYFLKKRYILPGYRQGDYYSQKMCDYINIDAFFAYLKGETPLSDHVSAHLSNSVVAALHYDRPTLWLEKELGFPLMKTKLPEDFYLKDIHWKWPAFRVFLPKGLLTIKRGGVEDSMMFIDLTRVKGNASNDIPSDLSEEIRVKFKGHYGKIPILYSEYDGMAVTGIMAMDSSAGPVGYAASCKLKENTIKELMAEVHERIASPTPTDELDNHFLQKTLALGMNILMFMGTLPAVEEGEEILRKPCLSKPEEGKRQYSGLYVAKFVGESQFRGPHKASGAHSGRVLPAHWRAGHWKRVPVGKGKQERRLTWINLYQTHGQDMGGAIPV